MHFMDFALDCTMVEASMVHVHLKCFMQFTLGYTYTHVTASFLRLESLPRQRIRSMHCHVKLVSYACQSDRDKPWTKFFKGIYKGKLMAKEYTGVLLIMAALLWSEKGKSLLSKACKKDFCEEGKLSDWVMLVETLLQWEAYLHFPQMPREEVVRLKCKNRLTKLCEITINYYGYIQ